MILKSFGLAPVIRINLYKMHVLLVFVLYSKLMLFLCSCYWCCCCIVCVRTVHGRWILSGGEFSHIHFTIQLNLIDDGVNWKRKKSISHGYLSRWIEIYWIVVGVCLNTTSITYMNKCICFACYFSFFFGLSFINTQIVSI